MPDGCVQFRLQGQDFPQELITVHSPVMDGLVGRVDHMARPILRKAAAAVIVGAFLLRQLPDAALNLIFNLVHDYRSPFCQFVWRALVC